MDDAAGQDRTDARPLALRSECPVRIASPTDPEDRQVSAVARDQRALVLQAHRPGTAEGRGLDEPAVEAVLGGSLGKGDAARGGDVGEQVE
jgi:hypothetical protein